MNPVAKMLLDCLPKCISEENTKSYEDTTARDFLHQRLIDLGLIKK